MKVRRGIFAIDDHLLTCTLTHTSKNAQLRRTFRHRSNVFGLRSWLVTTDDQVSVKDRPIQLEETITCFSSA